MAKSVQDIMTTLRTAGDYFLNSEYSVLWGGRLASNLNKWNDYIESVTIPGKTIQTNDSRTANSIIKKIATDVTFEDMEVTWRLNQEASPYLAIEEWQSAAKNYNTSGVMVTGYWDDYCLSNNCLIKVGPSNVPFVQIFGLYPTNMQTIQLSSEGGEYVKFSCTFACFALNYATPGDRGSV